MHSTIRRLALESNKILPLVDYLAPFIKDKKEVKIVDIGSGPFPKTGQYLEGVKIETHYCDRNDFAGFWEELGLEPKFKIEYQDMESLTYSDDYFDVAHCVNALDHTVDAASAVKEMLRIVKPGGWIYIHCNLDQLSSQGKKHYWDAKEDGTFVNKTTTIDLKEFGFKIKFIDNHTGIREQNNMIATLQVGEK